MTAPPADAPFAVIPAIDIIGGKCVRLTQGDYAQQTAYSAHPLDVAKSFADAGLTRLHLVDLDGARLKRVVNLAVLEQIATHTDLRVDFGGGVQSDADLAAVFDAGAAQVTGGSIAVRDPALFAGWLARYGPERIILGADVRAGFIAISGWQEATPLSIFDFVADYTARGIRYVISTDVAKDGLLEGASVELYAQLRARFPALRLIASGGVRHLADLRELRALGLHGAIVGKAIYENRVTLAELASL